MKRAAGGARRLAWVLGVGFLGLGMQAGPSQQTSQVQVGMHFLMEVLRGDYRAAYARLDPAMRGRLAYVPFRDSARVLWARGELRGRPIELYKLGYRVGEAGPAQGFVAFSFAADSLVQPKPEWLDVTFRDGKSLEVVGFAVRRGAVDSRQGSQK